MNLRHGLLGLAFVGSLVVLAAPVVAGSGWLLLAPPELPGHGEGGTKFEVHAPLDRWTQVRAFDTARECEDGKVHGWLQAMEEVKTLVPYPPGRNERAEEIVEKYAPPDEARDARLTEEEKEKVKRYRQEWTMERNKIEAARWPKRQAVNERYRLRKCVPEDAVYGPGVKRQP
jgi:hypothetical protein